MVTACLGVVHRSGRQVEIRFGSRADSTANKLSIGNGKEEKIRFYSCVWSVSGRRDCRRGQRLGWREVRFPFVFSFTLHTFVCSCATTRELVPDPTGPRPPVELPCEEWDFKAIFHYENQWWKVSVPCWDMHRVWTRHQVCLTALIMAFPPRGISEVQRHWTRCDISFTWPKLKIQVLWSLVI